MTRPGGGRDSLRSGQVHVWVAGTSLPPHAVQDCWTLLADDERARADRYIFPQDRARFVAARAFLRSLLARYTGVPARAIQFAVSAHGKPALAAPAGPSFNLSHSLDVAVCAVAQAAVGVDVEHVRPMPDVLGIAARFFSPEEFTALQRVPPERLERCFFTCWTRKEAYVKAMGRGLSFPLDQFSVSIEPDAPARLSGPGTDGWTSMNIDAAAGYVGALVVEGRGAHVTQWTWED